MGCAFSVSITEDYGINMTRNEYKLYKLLNKIDKADSEVEMLDFTVYVCDSNRIMELGDAIRKTQKLRRKLFKAVEEVDNELKRKVI